MWIMTVRLSWRWERRAMLSLGPNPQDGLIGEQSMRVWQGRQMFMSSLLSAFNSHFFWQWTQQVNFTKQLFCFETAVALLSFKLNPTKKMFCPNRTKSTAVSYEGTEDSDDNADILEGNDMIHYLGEYLQFGFYGNCLAVVPDISWLWLWSIHSPASVLNADKQKLWSDNILKPSLKHIIFCTYLYLEGKSLL